MPGMQAKVTQFVSGLGEKVVEMSRSVSKSLTTGLGILMLKSPEKTSEGVRSSESSLARQ